MLITVVRTATEINNPPWDEIIIYVKLLMLELNIYYMSKINILKTVFHHILIPY